MPDKATIDRARKDRREGKSPSTQAGEFVRAEIEKIRRGEHGARSPEQAIAIGLSEARRAGVPLKSPGKGKSRTRRSGRTRRRPRVARAVKRALEREPRSTVSRSELSRHARRAASRRSATARSAASRKASRTKTRGGRSAAAKKAARTRRRRSR